MSDFNLSRDDQAGDVDWVHLDYYVRRHEGELVLVQMMLKRQSDQGEIVTIYIGLHELDELWTEAVLIQGEHLEDGKSCAFVPPDDDEDSFYDDEETPDDDLV
jgi:hypothetical protein